MKINKRVSKNWEINPRINITEFDIDTLSEDNLINQLLVLKQENVSYSLMMILFGSYNGKKLCSQYDTFTVPVGGFSFLNENGKEVSNTNTFVTTIGIWLFNIFFLKGFNFSFLFGGYYNNNIDNKLFGDINQTLVYALAEDKIGEKNNEPVFTIVKENKIFLLKLPNSTDYSYRINVNKKKKLT